MRDRYSNSVNQFMAVAALLSLVVATAAPTTIVAQTNPTPIAHTYYLDYDQDSYGSKTVTTHSYSPAPPSRVWVSWCNDPDDQNSTVFPVPAAKGARTLGLDWSDAAADGRWREDLARELGIEATTLRLQWGSLETSPGTYDGAQVAALQLAADLYRAQGIKLNLTVSPIESGFLTLPEDLRADLGAAARCGVRPDLPRILQVLQGHRSLRRRW